MGHDIYIEVVQAWQKVTLHEDYMRFGAYDYVSLFFYDIFNALPRWKMTNGSGEVRMNRMELQAVLLRFAQVPYGIGVVPMRVKFQCSLPPDCYLTRHPHYFMGDEYYPCHQCKVVTTLTNASYELPTDLTMEMCPLCSGSGSVMNEICPSCLGLCVLHPLPDDADNVFPETCEVCESTGLLLGELCRLFDGLAAKRQRGPTISVSEDYQRIHLCLERILDCLDAHQPKLHPLLRHAIVHMCDSKLKGMQEILEILESFLTEDRLQLVVNFN